MQTNPCRPTQLKLSDIHTEIYTYRLRLHYLTDKPFQYFRSRYLSSHNHGMYTLDFIATNTFKRTGQFIALIISRFIRFLVSFDKVSAEQGQSLVLLKSRDEY